MLHNKFVSKIAITCGLIFSCFMSAQFSHAESNHAFGLSYSSGFGDVVDWHDENLVVEDDFSWPIGLSYRYIHTFESDLRMDVGVGPISLIAGDITYHDIPTQLTLGYTFLKDGGFSPYIRGGVVYHLNGGDYVKTSADFGILGALGAEIGTSRVKFFAEVAVDTAEATFSTAEGNQLYVVKNSQEDIAVLDVHVTIGITF